MDEVFLCEIEALAWVRGRPGGEDVSFAIVVNQGDNKARAQKLLFERFEVIDELGQGGFGRVFHVRDRETRAEVALKQLHRFGPEALLSFKQEFRALADVQHPNLVRFGELLESDGRWGFTMELVPGIDLLSYTRTREGFDEERVCSVLVQLTHGLVALHGLGLLHRDVKPENVRVTSEGRVVLLDFGLVAHLSGGRSSSGSVSPATVEYMAPEQVMSEPLGTSADFYSLGVLLYEVLTGRLPFEGAGFQIMLDKQQRDPVPPSSLTPGIPAHFDALCLQLLSRDPKARPTGEEVLAAFGRTLSSLPPARIDGDLLSEVFIGRTLELEALHMHFHQARQTGARFVTVEGDSGVGKSGLVRRFAEVLSNREPELIVLSGRCHAAEQVPFKMFDGVVDELARYLASVDRDECAACMTENVGLTPMLFPVLGHVQSISDLAVARRRRRGATPVEQYALFSAFIEFLVRLSERHPVLVIIDDLQWGDEDGIHLARALLDAERSPRLMILGTVRRVASLEGALAGSLRGLFSHPRARSLSIAELSREDATRLSAHWLGTSSEDPRAAELALEASGHPLFISELASRHTSFPPAPARSLDDALRARMNRLSSTPRGVLELLAVASAPMSLAHVEQALSIDSEALAHAALELRNARLVRSVRRGELACYHDRIREALLSGLPAEDLAKLHYLLGRTLGSDPSIDPARVAQHFIAGGALENALPRLVQAIDRALETAAFQRAAELCRDMLELGANVLDREHAHRLRLARADALLSSGRSEESARVLLDALSSASKAERGDLEVRAAQALLQAGQIEEGLAAARGAVQDAGLSWPGSSASAAVRLVWHRLVLAMRGMSTLVRSESDVPQHVRAQLDTLWRLWQPLIWVDLLRNVEIGARHLNLALRAGPARHAGFALLAEAMLTGMRDSPQATERLLERAKPFVDAANTKELFAYETFVRGNLAFLNWDLRGALRELEASERRYREECPGEAWMLTNVRSSLLSVLFSLGEHRHQAQLSALWMQEAQARGDKFALASYGVLGFGFCRHLMRDDVEAARALVQGAMQPWRTGSFGVQHLGEAAAHQSMDGYAGGTVAYEYWQQLWPKIRGSLLAKAPFSRSMIMLFRADAVLRAAVSAESQERTARLEEAKTLATSMKPTRLGVASLWGPLIAAQVALLQGQPEQARSQAVVALENFQQTGHFVERHCALLLAYLDGRATFERQRQALKNWLVSEGWAAPERAISAWLPSYDWLLRHDASGG